MHDGSYLRRHATEIEAAVEEHNQRVYGGEMPAANKTTLRNRIKFHLTHQKPGNYHWLTLQNEFGFTGDYTEADTGMSWGDVN